MYIQGLQVCLSFCCSHNLCFVFYISRLKCEYINAWQDWFADERFIHGAQYEWPRTAPGKTCDAANISPIKNFLQSLKCLGNTFHLFQLQLSRATPALLFVYMAAMVGVGLLGLTGCWQQSANKLILTAAIQVANKQNHEKMKTQANTKTKTMNSVTWNTQLTNQETNWFWRLVWCKTNISQLSLSSCWPRY